MRHDGKNERKRVRLIVSIDADGDEVAEINNVYQLLRTAYATRNLTVGGVREAKDTRRAG